MRWIAFVLVAVIALASVVAQMAPHLNTPGSGRTDLWNQNPCRIPRLEADLRGARSRESKRYSGNSGNDKAIEAYREVSNRSQTELLSRDSLGTTSLRGKQQGIWP